MKFKYCPKCGRKDTSTGGAKHLCRKCGYEFYFNPAPGVSIIVENDNREIMLVLRGRAPNKGYWDFLGGFVEPRENVEMAVVRETKEEIGVKVHNIKYIGSSPERYLYKGINYHTLNLIMSAEIKSGKIRPADDVSAVKFFAQNKIPWKRLAFNFMHKVLRDYVKNFTNHT